MPKCYKLLIIGGLHHLHHSSQVNHRPVVDHKAPKSLKIYFWKGVRLSIV